MLSPTVISILALCISAVGAASAAAAIWWHCKADHIRAGIMWDRSMSNQKRLDRLEKREDVR